MDTTVEKSLSVIIPTYNVEKYIAECLDSILIQGDFVKEIIVIDDGSADKTVSICDEYAKKNGIIKVLCHNHKGVAASRNAGLAMAKGSLIAFADGDDYLRLGMYDKLINALIENEADISICNYDRVSEDGKEIVEHPQTVKDSLVTGYEALRWAEIEHYWSYVVLWNRIYRREVFEGVRFPEGKIHEDEYVFHKIFLNCKKIVTISDSLYCYRTNPKSIMAHGITGRTIDGFDAFCNRFNEYYAMGYKELLRGAIDCTRKYSLSKICAISNLSREDKKKLHKVVNEFRDMIRKAKREAGMQNRFIALFPIAYYRVRKMIKGR